MRLKAEDFVEKISGNQNQWYNTLIKSLALPVLGGAEKLIRYLFVELCNDVICDVTVNKKINNRIDTFARTRRQCPIKD